MDYEIYKLGDVQLSTGQTLRDAKLAYKTYGTLKEDKSNAVVYPTWYSGQHYDNEWLIGEGMTLDLSKYFIIVPNMPGNGLSSSPSNTRPPHDGGRFANVTVYDNVEQQHRLVTDHFGIESLALVTGWSMAAGQTFIAFLEGVRYAIMTDAAWQEDMYDKQPVKGLRAGGRVHAGWGLSQAFYWQQLYKQAPFDFATPEDFLVGFWEGFFLAKDANNLLTMAWTWQNGDIGQTPGFEGDHQRALASIQAKAFVMPAQKDLYFPPEDEEYAVSHMPNAELRIIPGVWGHFAGGGVNPTDIKFIDEALRELLGS